jgi:hypothetical protein
MNQLIFEGVRCFHSLHACPLKPITLLVGENSSGKTTFLALNRIAWDIAEGDLGEDIFNEEPFMLGSYDQIASFRGGKAGRAKSFTVGFDIALKATTKRKASDLFADQARVTARFVPKGSEPKIDEWRFECGNFILTAKQSTKPTQLDITVTTPQGIQHIDERLSFRRWISVSRMLAELRFLLAREFRVSKDDKAPKPAILTEIELKDLQDVSFQVSEALGQRPYAFAPIRTRPQRTYDPLKDVPKPEGSHVPMVLARTFLEEPEKRNRLLESLNSFGQASGLFNSVEVKRKGQKESDPFQIGIKTTGPVVNLVDVGYGVSQVLPIIVDAVQNPNDTTFLLQQPEVHLHPRAQAELGSFLATLAKQQNKRFIVETHSDYLIDRIRMDIRDKKYLNPDDVVILYFEKSPGGVDIHTLEFDESGNILNAPSTYRQFFLDEERRMLGV